MIAARIRAAQPPIRSASYPEAPALLGDAADLHRMELSLVVRHSLAESERFYRGIKHDTRFAYELFRRAIVEQNDVAWEYIYTHYSPLVES